jgi:hypothetical protein
MGSLHLAPVPSRIKSCKEAIRVKVLYFSARVDVVLLCKSIGFVTL